MINPALFRHARHVVDYQAGEALFVVDQPGDSMYAVLDGQVDLLLRERVLDAIGPGGILGEMALVDAAPRSATAVARVPSRVARITKDEFTFLVHEHPTFALEVMGVLAERLRDANLHRT
jgi:CRP-like cAMP-binding protein